MENGLSGNFVVEKFDISLSGGLKSAKPKKNAKAARRVTGTWLYLGLVGQIGYTVAVPLVAGALLGAFIDRTMGTKPALTLIGLGLGVIISVAGLVRTIKETIAKKV